MTAAEPAGEYPVCLESWRQAQAPQLGRRKRYPFRLSPSDHQPRPFVFLKITSYADPKRSTVFPGLIDSGAHTSLAPRSLCDRLGIPLNGAPSCSPSSGIDGRDVSAFAHSFTLGVYDEPAIDGRKVADFGPFTAGLQVLNSDFPYVLLGQRDFLARFLFAQSSSQGWFELQWNI